MTPTHLKYTEEHEWISIEDDIVTIGITDHATEELGEIVFVELPEVGSEYALSDEFGTVESVKTVSSLYTPVTGAITEANTALNDEPNLINDSPFESGWIIKMKIEDKSEYEDLMTHEEYQAFLENL